MTFIRKKKWRTLLITLKLLCFLFRMLDLLHMPLIITRFIHFQVNCQEQEVISWFVKSYFIVWALCFITYHCSSRVLCFLICHITCICNCQYNFQWKVRDLWEMVQYSHMTPVDSWPKAYLLLEHIIAFSAPVSACDNF